MLSYRHAFHAGNPADVLKHLVLFKLLVYLMRKDKPLCYIDTHAGAGGYDLDSAEAEKNHEYAAGIGRLWSATDLPEGLADYLALVKEYNPHGQLQRYPGSPWIARTLLRATDRLFLYELHPAEISRLQKTMAGDRRIKIYQQDGYEAVTSLLPPQERRGLVLIDPPYECKQDYTRVVKFLQLAVRRFATGVYALWYPVVDRARIQYLEKVLTASGIRRIQLYELGVSPDRPGYGMTASGLVVINGPWGLQEDLQGLLTVLQSRLAPAGHTRIVELVGE